MIKVMYKSHLLDTVKTLAEAIKLYLDINPDDYDDMWFIVGSSKPVGAFSIAFARILEAAFFEGYNSALLAMGQCKVTLNGNQINPQDQQEYGLLSVLEALNYPTHIAFDADEGLVIL